MPLYEHTLIARPDLSSSQAQVLAEEMGQILAANGGEIKKTEYWGLRTMAYKVKKNRKGHYLHFNVEAPAAALQELERQERIHDDVMRYLSVKVEELIEGPSQVMQARSGRDERGGRDDRGPRGDRGDRGPRGDRDDRGPRGDRDDRGPRGDRG